MKRWLLILLGVLSVSAGSAELGVRLKTRSIRRGQEIEILQALETGALQPMLRARALGQRAAAARDGDSRAGVLLAFTDAMLARLFGLDTDPEAAQELRRAARCARPAADSLCGTVEALLSLGRGQVDLAREQAQQAAQLAPGEPFPLIALAMCHARAGALAAASKVLEAVMVREPQLVMARVVWAEVRIDLGDSEAAALELQSVLGRAPGHSAAALLLSEARTAVATDRRTPPAPASADRGAVAAQPGPVAELEADCDRDRRVSPVISTACALDEAARGRLEGRLDVASARALAAASTVPPVPRLLSRVAQLLAQLGYVDAAASVMERASTVSGAELQGAAWAKAAITLGRGGVAVLPGTASITGPETRIIAARAAFAAGGRAGLAALLSDLGPGTVAADPDLKRLARLLEDDQPLGRSAPAPGGAETAVPGPADAYIVGMRARLGKDNRTAVEWLSRALGGHGDACRAAGEYLDALRALRREPPPASAFAVLRAANRSCVNLPGMESAPPVREHFRAPIR